MNEEAIRFGPQRNLVGIVTAPEGSAHPDAPAVVFLNAGLMHRVGPNRTYVGLARALAAQGLTTLRFDFSGMGDSRPRTDLLPYIESAPAEAILAMDWLAEHRNARTFLLIGHCAGAGVSLLVAGKDPRVAGAILLNLEGGEAAWTEHDRMRKVSLMHARDYGRHALFSRERWAKLLRGKANYRSIFRILIKDILWYRLSGAAFAVRQALQGTRATARAAQAANAVRYLDPILGRGGRLMIVHAEGSTGQKQMQATFGAELNRRVAAGKVEMLVVAQSDHLFTLVARQRRLCREVVGWATRHFVSSDGQTAREGSSGEAGSLVPIPLVGERAR